MKKIANYDTINWREFVYYDESSRTFLRWKIDRFSGKNHTRLMKAAGDEAGFIDSNKYAIVKLNKVKYYSHRVIWYLFNGNADEGVVIDHIDGDTANNNITNLRAVSQIVNLRNQSLYSNSKTGVSGVKSMNNGHSNYYVATWYSLEGKQKQKYFSISEFGGEEAFRLACEYREQKISELNSQGAGYTQRHGQKKGDIYMSKRIVCAAIRNAKGRVIIGARHYDGIMHTTLNYCKDFSDWEDHSQITQGFIDQRGNFLTREEAFDIAEANGQIIRLCGSEDKRELYSENLY